MLLLVACSRPNPNVPDPVVPVAVVTSRPLVIDTSTPSPSPTAADTPTPLPLPEAIITVNLNVRRGPGISFEKIGLLATNSTVTLNGRSADNAWWQIVYPTGPEGVGWIAAEYAPIADPAILPVLTVTSDTPPATSPTPLLPVLPPPPTLTPTAKPLPPGVTPTVPLYRLTVNLLPQVIYTSECAQLRYHVERLSELTLNGEPIAPADETVSLIVCPETTTTYTITGRNINGSPVSESITLTVLPATPTARPDSVRIPVSTTAGCRFALDTLGTLNSNLCRFAPDGQRLAAPAADGSLWVVSTDGKAFEQVVDPGGRFLIVGDVLWSPNGDYLAFSATGIDQTGTGVGYYQLSTGNLDYLGPDAQLTTSAPADWPRWTQDGRLLITWYLEGRRNPGSLRIFAPPMYTAQGPARLAQGTELILSAGNVGQQVYPWKPGRVWRVGQSPSYEAD